MSQKAQVDVLTVGGDRGGTVNKKDWGGIVVRVAVTGVRDDTGRRFDFGNGLRGRGGGDTDEVGGSGDGVAGGDGVGDGRNNGSGADGDEERGDGGGKVRVGNGDGRESGDGVGDHEDEG